MRRIQGLAAAPLCQRIPSPARVAAAGACRIVPGVRHRGLSLPNRLVANHACLRLSSWGPRAARRPPALDGPDRCHHLCSERGARRRIGPNELRTSALSYLVDWPLRLPDLRSLRALVKGPKGVVEALALKGARLLAPELDFGAPVVVAWRSGCQCPSRISSGISRQCSILRLDRIIPRGFSGVRQWPGAYADQTRPD